MTALVLYGTGPGFSKPFAREQWNQAAERQALAYETKGCAPSMMRHEIPYGMVPYSASRSSLPPPVLTPPARRLEALMGSDKNKGHCTSVGLAHAARRTNAQRDDDPLYATHSAALPSLPHLRQEWATAAHICAKTGPSLATSAPDRERFYVAGTAACPKVHQRSRCSCTRLIALR